MALGRRRSEHQDDFCVATDELGNSPRKASLDQGLLRGKTVQPWVWTLIDWGTLPQICGV